MTSPGSRTFVAYVEDKPGVLNRVASLFRRRNFNIESLNVGKTHMPGVSRMTFVASADRDTALRVEANLYKLVNVLHVEDITDAPAVYRLLALIKVRVEPAQRPEVLQLVEVFRAKVVDVSASTLVVELAGTGEKVEGLVAVLRPYGIEELVQTGVVAMERGSGHGPSLASASLRPRFD